ncbi:unnamed protein product [Sphagnum troendelagicum]
MLPMMKKAQKRSETKPETSVTNNPKQSLAPAIIQVELRDCDSWVTSAEVLDQLIEIRARNIQTHLVAACIKDTLGAVIHVLSQTLCILCTFLPLQVQNMDSSTQSVPGQYLSFFRKR